MIRTVRFVLALAAGACLAAAAAAPRAQDGAPSLAQRDKIWPQSYVRIAPDPAAKFGVLPNGVRYVIVANATPSKQASFRLRVGSGSLDETDPQQGIAHFIEHMAFNGSTHVPQGEMIRILERHGLAFGADTNADTEATQTVYQLDLPQADADTIDTALMLMRETAGELTLAQSAIDTERGVILSEERARDTPGYRVLKARLEFLLKGQLAPRRMPIGSVDVLRGANTALLRSYYDAWYRPDRITVVAVGDFDPEAVEAKIRARFGDLKARAADPGSPNLGVVARRGTEAKVLVDPGSSTSVSVSWIRPFDAAPDSDAKRRRDLIEQIGFQVLNRRLERLARGDSPPFINAGAGDDDVDRSAKVVSLSVTTDPDHWREGLAAAEDERRRAVEYGVRQDEVDREVAELRARYQSAADGAATRRTPRVANELVQTIDDAEVYTSPQEDLTMFRDATLNLGAVEVSQALKAAFVGQGPLIFLGTSKPVEGGEQALLTALETAESAPVSPPPVVATKTWPYAAFGPPGVVADMRDVVDLDTTFVRFANGVRLTVKPTKFREQQIEVSVRIGHGRSGLPKVANVGWAAGAAFIEGGLKDLDKEDLEQVLAAKIYGAQFGIGDDAFTLSGATRPQDLETQMQVLTAYIADPGWRPEAFLRMKTVGDTMLRQMDATAQGVIRRDLPYLLHADDPRWRFPDAAQIAASKPDDVKALLQKPLANDPIEVVIVGDVDVDRAIKVVGDTLGSLPQRADDPANPADKAVRFPAPTPTPVEREHNGRADQSEAYIAWPTGDFFANPQEERALRLLQLVLERRMIDTIRAAEGATYSPSSGWESSLVYPGYGYISASVEIPPDKVASFYADVAKIVADLRDKPVNPDELERVRKPHLDTIEKSQQTNEYWLSQLSGAQEDPRLLDAIRASLAGLERVRAADIQHVAQTYLTDARAWKLVIRPGPNALPAPAPTQIAEARPAEVTAPTPAPEPIATPDEPPSRVVGPAVEPEPADAPPPPPEKPPRPKPHRG